MPCSLLVRQWILLYLLQHSKQGGASAGIVFYYPLGSGLLLIFLYYYYFVTQVSVNPCSTMNWKLWLCSVMFSSASTAWSTKYWSAINTVSSQLLSYCYMIPATLSVLFLSCSHIIWISPICCTCCFEWQACCFIYTYSCNCLWRFHHNDPEFLYNGLNIKPTWICTKTSPQAAISQWMPVFNSTEWAPTPAWMALQCYT